jgi:hypothetical protein
VHVRAHVLQIGNGIWQAIKHGKVLEKPELLLPAVMVVYCDLKRHCYRHRCAFPHFVPPHPFNLVQCLNLSEIEGGAQIAAAFEAQSRAQYIRPLLVTISAEAVGEQVQLRVTRDAVNRLLECLNSNN